ncbi:MAG: energy-coupling factor transporter transmembrane component T family protein [Lachnospirales bacterium]
MIGNITIGQYYPVNSNIHRLDPRTKILATLVYLILLFNVDNFVSYGVVIGFFLIIVKLSNVPLIMILKGLKAIFIILIFTSVLNIFFTQGTTVLFEIGVLTVTLEGVIMAIKTAIRLILLISFSSILTLTTSPIELTNGIEDLLNPLKKVKVPAHEIAMMMTIALRFIPTLIEELDRIMKAQMARGSEFDTGGLMQKAKSLVPVLVPLFISSFRRADELAMAMEARCYRGDINRTKMKKLKYSSLDIYALLSFILVFVIVFFTNRLNVW